VNYSGLIGVLVEAVKEQQKLVQQQQEELKSLREIGIGEGLTAFALPHHRAYGSVHGGSSRLA
jgi:hypothetical protein